MCVGMPGRDHRQVPSSSVVRSGRAGQGSPEARLGRRHLLGRPAVEVVFEDGSDVPVRIVGRSCQGPVRGHESVCDLGTGPMDEVGPAMGDVAASRPLHASAQSTTALHRPRAHSTWPGWKSRCRNTGRYGGMATGRSSCQWPMSWRAEGINLAAGGVRFLRDRAGPHVGPADTSQQPGARGSVPAIMNWRVSGLQALKPSESERTTGRVTSGRCQVTARSGAGSWRPSGKATLHQILLRRPANRRGEVRPERGRAVPGPAVGGVELGIAALAPDLGRGVIVL